MFKCQKDLGVNSNSKIANKCAELCKKKKKKKKKIYLGSLFENIE